MGEVFVNWRPGTTLAARAFAYGGAYRDFSPGSCAARGRGRSALLPLGARGAPLPHPPLARWAVGRWGGGGPLPWAFAGDLSQPPPAAPPGPLPTPFYWPGGQGAFGFPGGNAPPR